MKSLLLACFVVSVLAMAWRFAPPDSKDIIGKLLVRHSWVPAVAVLVVLAIFGILSIFSIKLF